MPRRIVRSEEVVHTLNAVLNYIAAYSIGAHPPSMSQVKQYLKLEKRQVENYFSILKREGYLVSNPNHHRSWKVLKRPYVPLPPKQ